MRLLTQLQRHASELAANPSAWMPWNFLEQTQSGHNYRLRTGSKIRQRFWLGATIGEMFRVGLYAHASARVAALEVYRGAY
jgi:hypothetical protein